MVHSIAHFGKVAPVIGQIYSAFESGAITQAQAVIEMQSVATQFHGAYAGAGVKVKSCNDGCGMDAILAAHVNLIGSLPAPVPATASGVTSLAGTSGIGLGELLLIGLGIFILFRVLK